MNEIATFGAGCFWGPQLKLSKLPGIIKTTVGFSGGNVENPTYEEVTQGNTGHSEVVRVEYDPKKISYKKLLDEFWKMGAPEEESITQYKSLIFFHTQEQEKIAKESKPKNVKTEILPAPEFYEAEEYHQDYFKKQGR